MKNSLVLIPLAVCAVLLALTSYRGVDPDEWEHLHAACCVARGELPYRDFFEHHGPALYYLLSPIFGVVGPELPALTWSRTLMWLFSVGTLVLVGRLTHRVAGPTAAMVAPALLCVTTVFFWKSIEIRPDVPAMFLITAAAGLLVRVAEGKRRAAAVFAAGVSLGLAMLLTQKALVVAAAMAVAWAVRRKPERSRRSTAVELAFMVFGALLPWLVAFGLFGLAGGAAAFFEGVVGRLWHWPVRESPWTALRPTLAADLPLWFGAAAAVAATIGGRFTNGPSTSGRLVETPSSASSGREFLAMTVLFCVLGGLAAQAAYVQYYLLWFPLASALAGDQLVRWAGGPFDRKAERMILATVAALILVETALAVHAFRVGQGGALPHWFARAGGAGFQISIVVMLVLAIAAVVCCRRDCRAAAVFCAVALGFGYAGLRDADAVCWSNHRQRAAVALVNRLVPPDETVFDGFTGFGVFRRHAYYYWWLNRYSLAMMTPDQRDRQLLTCLENDPPRVVCLDENVLALPAPVLRWIAENYDPATPPIYLRKTTKRPSSD
ncbi:MAG: glycosyltransferase family 39 protein [Thermoguttaceae bacterium]